MAWFVAVALLLLAPGAAWVARQRAGRMGAAAWRRLLPDLGSMAFLGLATLGFFWRVAVGQNWMPADGGDLVSFLYPTYHFAAETLRAGAWPLWDPHLYAGAPHAADIQAGFLYPPNLLLFLLWPDFPYRALQWLSIGSARIVQERNSAYDDKYKGNHVPWHQGVLPGCPAVGICGISVR